MCAIAFRAISVTFRLPFPTSFQSRPHSLLRFPNKQWQRSSRTVTTVMQAIEVEKKFKVSKSTVQQLQTMAHEQQFEELHDWYFCEQLAIEDIWVRKRNEEWEVKLPISSKHRQSDSTVYRELKGLDVWDFLRAKHPKMELVPFAHLHTKRTQTSFPWMSHFVNVVVDRCTSENGFEMHVGEVEIVVGKPSEVDDAVRALDDVARHIGVELDSGLEGKLMSYLRLHKDELYMRIIKKGSPS